MSPELTLYYEGVSLASISNMLKVSPNAINKRLHRERERLGLLPREHCHALSADMVEFTRDRHLVIELLACGMSVRTIADKWDVDRATVKKYMELWGYVSISDVVHMTSVTLTEFSTFWPDMDGDFIVTVNTKPMFRVTRI